jgi:hypothetical protein
MFYTQCNNCNERWELGTTNICTCVTNGSATILVDSFSHLGQRTWVGLTNKETVAIELGLRIPTGYRDAYDLSLQDFAKAIEQALKERNA